jgi:hypothetical protein
MEAFNLYVSSLRARINTLHLLYGVLSASLGIICLYSFYVNSTLREELKNPVAFLVPGHIPDVIKVRANSVPDSVVFDFFDFIAAQIGNISSEQIEIQYAALERYLSPEFKARFRAAAKNAIPLWKDRRIDQLISFKPPERFDRVTENGASLFTLTTWITVQRYMDGKALKPYRERLEISFRTSAVDESKAWIFEITNIKRETEDEYQSRTEIK